MNVRNIVAVLLMAAMAFTLCACGGSGDAETQETTDAVTTLPADTQDEVKEEITFTVKVVDGEGNAISGVNVQVCDDSNCFISPSPSSKTSFLKNYYLHLPLLDYSTS